MPNPGKLAVFLYACSVLAGCAAVSNDAGAPLSPPEALSAMHSEFNAMVSLVATPGASAKCEAPECGPTGTLETRIAAIGPLLAGAAFEQYPEVEKRVRKFEFLVADKAEPGTVSTSLGRIIVLRPVEALAPDGPSLAFVLAREIGHVAAGHHEDNAFTAFIISGIAQILFPIANLTRLFGANFGAQTAATNAYATGAATASVSTASFAGSRIVLETYKPRQIVKADEIAMNLLTQMGHDASAVAAAFGKVDLKSPKGAWVADLRGSVERLAERAARERSFPLGMTDPLRSRSR